MLSIRKAYTKACSQSDDVHSMTDDERQKLQAHLRKMYKDVEAVCDRHGLRFVAAFGSVLGALRHQGFIPWDDDMDILMPRADFNELVNKYADELPPQYRIYAPNTKNGPLTTCFGKVVDTSTRIISLGSSDDPKLGIFLDIFILENCPTNRLVRKIRQVKQNFFLLAATCTIGVECDTERNRKLMTSTPELESLYKKRRFIGKLFSFRSAKAWANSFDKAAQYKKETGYLCYPCGGPKERHHAPYPVEKFFPAKKMKFDDIEVYVPADPEWHCTISYGDWTRIPPVDQRDEHFIEEIRFN